MEDEYCWLVIDIEYPYWEVRRDREDKQPWTQHVWFKGAVPRHAFNFWICCFDRLPTRARIASRGLQTSLSCCLCGSFNETRDHLLLRCEFSKKLLNLALRRRGQPQIPFNTWDAFSAWIFLRDNLTPRKLNGLVSEAVIYSLRTELNRRLHGANTLTFNNSNNLQAVGQIHQKRHPCKPELESFLQPDAGVAHVRVMSIIYLIIGLGWSVTDNQGKHLGSGFAQLGRV